MVTMQIVLYAGCYALWRTMEFQKEPTVGDPVNLSINRNDGSLVQAQLKVRRFLSPVRVGDNEVPRCEVYPIDNKPTSFLQIVIPPEWGLKRV